MGLDLTVFPLKNLQGVGDKSVLLCSDKLRLSQDYEIFRQLIDIGEGNVPTIKTISIPPQMWIEIFEDEGLRRTREDAYGIELTFVYVQQLRKLKVADDASPKNKAIKAFIDALPDDAPIILYWC